MKSTVARSLALTTAVTTVVAGLAGCSLTGGEPAEDDAGTTTGGGTVVLVTHDTFKLPKKLERAFEEESGYELEVRPSGDAGALTTKLVLTADNPTGDVAFGVDNTFASRALDEDVFAATDVALPAGAEEYALAAPEDAERLLPIDNGSVCVNVDTTWFAERDLEPPTSLEDLTEPAYEGLFVTTSALSSSVGMAFLLSSIAEYGDGWPAYWERLMANDTLIVDGWNDAYFGEFTQGSAKGSRPIVLSYDSSPAYTVPKGSDESSTAALLDTCFRQVEYAGVLTGADNPEGAQALLEFLLSDPLQAALPKAMYVFPVVDSVELPAEWAAHAEQPTAPYEIDPSEVDANRETWLEEWRDVVTR